MIDSFIVDEATRLRDEKLAVGYYREEYGLKASKSFDSLKLYNGSGSMFSTAKDMGKWDKALHTEQLVKAATLKQALLEHT
jgi:hypothetical protein